MKNRYLFAINSRTVGGAEKRIIKIIKHIDKNSYSVTLAVKKNVFSDYIDNANTSVVELPILKNNNLLQKYIKYYRFIRHYNPNVVVFSQFWLVSFSLPELLAAFLITKGNVYMIVHDEVIQYFKPYKSHIHFGFIPGIGLERKLERLFQKLLVYFTKRTFAVSDSVKYALVNLHRYPEKKIKVMWHGVDCCKFAPSFTSRSIFRERAGIPDSDIVIISVSRLDKIKRIDRLIKAFSVEATSKNNIWLIVAGDGPEDGNLKSMIDKYEDDVRKRIKFTGFMEDVEVGMQASDYFVLPSESEGFCNACIQAMSCGLVCISTKCGGPTEYIIDGDNGFIVENSSEGILIGLRKCFSLRDEERKRISTCARKTIVEKFNIDNNIKSELSCLGLDSVI